MSSFDDEKDPEQTCLLEQALYDPLFPKPPFDELWAHIETCSICKAELDQQWQWYQDGFTQGAVGPTTLPSGLTNPKEFLSTWLQVDRREDEVQEHFLEVLERKLCTPQGARHMSGILGKVIRELHSFYLGSPRIMRENGVLRITKSLEALQAFLGSEAFNTLFSATGSPFEKYTPEEISEWLRVCFELKPKPTKT